MPKKLIEVALPLEAINKESAREKSIRHGHPSTLHLWWARRPLAACRAVLFASLVDDPSSHPEQFPTEEKQNEERQRLFRIIEDLVKWENSTNEKVLNQARAEIMRSCNGNPPPVLDPFCGGGSIPLEAQRLGLEAHGSDLNPVAVLITKALIEIPPKFANMPPVNPEAREKYLASKIWQGAQGLAEDVRYYGKWMRDEAENRIGHLYPKVQLPAEYGGGEATVIAWLWARTVKCPNPACGAMMPLVKSFALSTKKGKEAWIEPVIDKQARTINFRVKMGEGDILEGTISRRGAKCIVCNTPVPLEHIRLEGKARRMGMSLMAVVAERNRNRVYLTPTEDSVVLANQAKSDWQPSVDLPYNPRDFKTPNYGMRTFADLFTLRQLKALTTFSELIGVVREQVSYDVKATSTFRNTDSCANDNDLEFYADAIATYLGLGVSKLTAFHCTLAIWRANDNKTGRAFGRQAIPMVWDFPEVNPFADAGGELFGTFYSIYDLLKRLPASPSASVLQQDAATPHQIPNVCVSTDPPYYDNVGYADLSDFFYVWLRHSLSNIYPHLFSTLLVPKTQELVATPYRFDGNKEKAKQFFEKGLSNAFNHMRTIQHSNYPLTVYYAFKQTELDEDEDEDSSIASTGWETMLEALLQAGFITTGTWPMRTEQAKALKNSVNALASSIVLVCRPRPTNAQTATRREFLNALKKELPDALKKLQQGNIAPVDLAQASIGPGMAIYSRYSQVLESDGTPMPVRTALALINQALDEYLSEQEGEFDADTRWALAWFETVGMEEGAFGVAETLSKAKNTGIDGLTKAGILQAKSGKVRLLRREELLKDWDPTTDKRITAWEATQYLIRAIDEKGETGAAQLLNKLGSLGDVARDLAYRLYSICERKKWAYEAMAYNGLVIAWPEIVKLASQNRIEEQPSLF